MRSTGSARGAGGPASFALGLTRLGRARPPWINLSVGRGSSGRRAGASPTFSTDWFTTSLTFIPLAQGIQHVLCQRGCPVQAPANAAWNLVFPGQRGRRAAERLPVLGPF